MYGTDLHATRLHADVTAMHHFLQVQLAVVTPFECLGTVYNMLAKHGAAAGEEDYQSNGKVKLLLTADADQAESLQQAIADATSGKVRPTLVAASDNS
jgi:putative IMPACT (imprinted ancient) family translation regulator